MSELLSQAFRLVNFPFTILLLMIVLYWLLTALGAVGGDHGDGDLHAGHDASHDFHHELSGDGHHFDSGHHFDGGHHGHAGHFGHDAHHGHDAHGEHDADGLSAWHGVLRFLNLGDIPVMIILSMLTLSAWTISMLTNYYLADAPPLVVAACLIGNLVLSVVVTRYVTMPLKPLFRIITRQYDAPAKIVGQHCRIVTSEATPDFGQAEIPTNGVPLLIHVRTLNDAVLRRGEIAVVVREDGDRRIFFITPNPIPTQV